MKLIQLKQILFKNSAKTIAELFMVAAGMFFLLAAAGNDKEEIKLTKEMKVPKEVQNIVDNYVSDSNNVWGFNNNKEFLKISSSIHADDIKVSLPCRSFIMYSDRIEQSDDTIPVDSLIKQINEWYVFVYAYNKCIYFFTISSFSGPWQIASIRGASEDWQNLFTAWPEKKKINPVIVSNGPNTYVHFPKLGRYNLTPLLGGFINGKVYHRKFDSLDSSQTVLKEIKSRIKSRKKMNNEGRLLKY